MSGELHDDPPQTWVRARLSEIATVNPSGSTVFADDEDLVSFVPMAAVEELSGRVDLGLRRPFGAVKKGFTRFRNGDVLFAKITPCMENGKVAVAQGLAGGIGCGSTEFHVVRPHAGVHPDYLRYFLVQAAFRQKARRNMQGAVGQQRVPVEFLREAELPLPPSNEQQRIVSKLDELFSRMDEGERALERVQRLVARYRQSVLKAAVTGELTRAWREKRRAEGTPLESSETLLARILQARREAWEQAELAKMQAKGITPANDKWKERYVDPSPPDCAGLVDLPEGWVWASAEQLCGFITKGTTPPATAMTAGHGDVPYIKVYNLTFDGSLDFSKDPTFVSTETHRRLLSRSKVVPGDVVMNIVGPPLGKVSIVPATAAEWNMNQAVAVFRPFTGCDAGFLAWYLLSRTALDWYSKKAKATVGQVNLTLEICRATPVPLPPMSEQEAILELIGVEVSRLVNLAASLEHDRLAAAAMRQSVLSSAFSGSLVASDPSDEPASTLLQRTNRVDDAAPTAKRTSKRRTT